MPILSGSCSVEAGALDIVLGDTGADLTGVPVGSALELFAGGTYETRFVLEELAGNSVRVHRPFTAAASGVPYTLVPDLAGGNLTQRALERWDEDTAALEELISGVQAPAMEMLAGNPNDLRVTIGESDAVYDRMVAYTSFPEENTGPIQVRRNDSPSFPLFKRISTATGGGGEEYAAGEADPSEGIIIQYREELAGWLAIGRGGPPGADGPPGPPAPATGTSSSSLTVGTGSKTFVTQAGLGWTLGSRIRAANDAGTVFMEGVVTAYAGTNVTLNVDLTGGAGTNADWNLGIIGQPGATGATGGTGAPGATGARGGVGGGFALPYDFDTGTATADPGAGKLRFNGAPGAATAIYVSETALGAINAAALLGTLDDSTSTTNKGYVRVVSAADDSKFAAFYLTGSVTDQGAWWSIAVTPIGANLPSAFAAGEDVYLAFTQKGDIGSGGAVGPGDIGTTQLADNAATNAKLADMASDTVKARRAASSGDPEDVPLASLNGANPRLINGTLAASAASNALTVALKTAAGADPSAADPVYAMFPTTAGGFTWVKIIAAVSVTIPAGQTMGVVAATAFNIWAALFYDSTGPSVSMAVINCVDSSNNILRIGAAAVATTVAVSGASGTKTFYSGSALTAKPYITLGYLNFASGLTTPGTWANAGTAQILWVPGNPLPGERLNRAATFTNTQIETANTTFTVNSAVLVSITLQNAANIVEAFMFASLWPVTQNVQGYASMFRNGVQIGTSELALSSSGAMTITAACRAMDRPNSAAAVQYDGRCRNGGGGGTLRFPENSSGALIEVMELQG